MDDPVVALDRDGRCCFANPAAAAFEAARRPPTGPPPSDEETPLGVLLRSGKAEIDGAFATAAPCTFEACTGGHTYRIRVVPQGVGDGVDTVVCILKDITRVHSLETRLQEHEMQLRAVLDTMPDAVMMGNASGEIEGVNRAAERIFGYTEAELQGRNARVLFDGPLGQRDDLLARFGTAVLRFGQRGAYEAVGRRKDGSLVPCELLLAANDIGGRRYYTGLIRDVSERKAADRALQASGDRYRALSKLIRAFALEYRVEAPGVARLEWVTDTVTSVLGYTVAEALSVRARDLVHPDDAPLMTDVVARVNAGEEVTAEVRILTKRAGYVWLRLLAYPIFSDDGRVARIHASAQDVSEQKTSEVELIEAKERAEEAALLKDAFLASMSHEIRTPLTTILGFTEVLRMEASEELREYVDLIEVGGRRLMSTLTSVLELAQLRSKSVTLMPSHIAVQAVIEESVVFLQEEARQKGITLVHEPGPDVVLPLDQGAVVRILTTLVGNAIKFTDQGTITVSSAAEEAHLVLRVEDTGVGIDPAFLPHLFEEFRQESSGLSRAYEGNGLGLAITRQLVTLMGGTITVTSEQGVGSSFVVRLPVKLSAAFPPKGAPADARRPRLRVLVVENRLPNRLLLEIMLRQICDARIVSSPAEALAVANEQAFDVALLDLTLGADHPGAELRTLLAQTPWGAQARFVAMTDDKRPGDHEYFLAAGFDAVVAKPFASHRLYAALLPAS